MTLRGDMNETVAKILIEKDSAHTFGGRVHDTSSTKPPPPATPSLEQPGSVERPLDEATIDRPPAYTL